MYEACPRWLIEHCNIGPRSTVVDLGCGSGIVTRLLLQRFSEASDFRIIAVDPSQWELGIARSRIFDERVTLFRERPKKC
jgi:trans-aconitate methyltransferase